MSARRLSPSSLLPAASLLVAAVLTPVRARAIEDASAPSTRAVLPPMNDAPEAFPPEAAACLSALGPAPADATEAEAVDRLARYLADARRSGDDERLAATLRGFRPALARDVDLIDLLAAQRADPAARRALTVVCAMRALARIGTTDAVRQLIPVSTMSMGAFRPELLRLLKQLDERANAALVEAKADPSPDVRAWLKDALDVLGKRTPGDAVQTTNDQVLADVLHAFAETRDPEAVAVVLSFVHSDRRQVRAAAREATLAYGKEATPRVRSTYAALTGERLPEDVDPGEAARKLFEAYDHLRLHDVYARLDDGLAREKAGDLDGAIAAFDDVLARQPLLDRRAEMAPAYSARALARAHSDRAGALDDLRRALRLDDGPAADRTRSEMAYLDGEELLSRGIPDPAPFEHALALDPTNAAARSALDRLRDEDRSRRAREARFAAAAGVTGFALVALGIVALARRRSHRRAMLLGSRSGLR